MTNEETQIGNAKTFGLEKDLGLTGHKFGNITTLLSVNLVPLKAPWVMAIKSFGPNKALGTALLLCSFVKLDVCKAGISPGFSYLFSTVHPRNAAAKRLMMTNMANCTSGAFGDLFAYAVQIMGTCWDSRHSDGYLSSSSGLPWLWVASAGCIFSSIAPFQINGSAGAIIAWVATYVSPDGKRAVAMPFAYSIGNLSSLVSSQLYPSQQIPGYIEGNAISAGLDVVVAGLFSHAGCCSDAGTRRRKSSSPRGPPPMATKMIEALVSSTCFER
ncbi:hypothetical protein BGW36DRAFT_429472 [Talaromyces proteolyticus]|uniref:Uncharacterized protein n=1 Tax=Talaromyces proteolyticus TaxID=1131652 RepID=A0AAD4KTJ3_9EURO|nr:uncharacterized protein BGW36DRAFT_429472 [Talaromyces proteolyticus]KAH8695600.1 hypothetical protein BGW36DRAFT_429472 [Talaromyces proteolyticus]